MNKEFWVLVICGIMILQPINVFARPGDKGGGGGHPQHRREEVFVGNHRYHYQDGRFFRSGGLFGLFNILVRIPPVGAVVTVLPPEHNVIIVDGVTYFYYDNIYYTSCSTGYIVVNKPVIIKQEPVVVSSTVVEKTVKSEPAAEGGGDTITINIPDKDGGFTPVVMVKHDNGYTGPQGEYYPGHPTVEQLKVLYGN